MSLNRLLLPLIGIAIDPDADTLKDKAFRFRCSPIRRRIGGDGHYCCFEESAHVNSPEELVTWIQATMKANAGDTEPK